MIFFSKSHATKPKSFGESGRSNTSGGFQKSTSFDHNAKLHTEQKPSATTAGFKLTQREKDLALGVYYYCKKPGHILSACLQRHAEREQKDAPVQLVSTFFSLITQCQVNSTVVQKPQEVEPTI